MVRRLTFALIVVMLALSTTSTFVNGNKTQAFAQTSRSTINDDNSWYVGKGARENMYMKYQIQYNEINNGQPFNMTVYFDKFNSTGKYWIAPVFVEDGKGHALNATFDLFDSNLGVLPDSQIPPNVTIYQDAYSETLDWLSAFAQPPQSLDARSWGRIASLGGQEIRNLGNESVTVPAGTFDATIMGWTGGNITNLKIWINKDLPYPVKGEHFESPSKNTSLSLTSKFELLRVGDGMQNDKAAGYSNYVLYTNDSRIYNIQYKISNGTVESISSTLPRGTSLDIKINTTDNGSLELKLPRELADRFANIGGIYPMIPYKMQPIEVETTCDYRIFRVDFGHRTDQITLQGARLSSINNNPLAHYATLKVDVDVTNRQRSFIVETITNSKICSWQFIPEEKKLKIMVDGVMEVRPDDVVQLNHDAGMGITIPNEMLSAPYIVMMDGKKIDHIVDSSTENYTTMHFEYDQTSRVIEILGATAIPEFGSLAILAMTAGMIAAVGIGSKWRAWG